jgi:hypothetical protein
MKEIKEKDVPIGALTTWLRNIDGRKTFKIKGDGAMLDSLRTLQHLGGTTIVKNLRHSKYHMREIQKLLTLGLIEQVPKTCYICSERVTCLTRRRLCAARHLYSITMCGLKAVQVTQGVDDSSFYEIDVNIDPYWFKYFQTTVW